MISTRSLNELPDGPRLIKICKAIALLDAILSEDWESRYYSFNSTWTPTEMMASMRNGSGDDFFILFSPKGTAIKGFAHESVMSPYNGNGIFPGVLDDLPPEFDELMKEPAFSMEDTTFCIWRLVTEDRWHIGNIEWQDDWNDDPDGSAELLQILDGNPTTYQKYASEYFDIDLDLRDIEHVYAQKQLTDALLERAGCERSLDELAKDITEIGYGT